MTLRKLPPILIAMLLLGAAGSAFAQRPLNVPNYLLSTTPTLPLNTTVEGQLDTDDGQNFKDGSYLDLYTFDGSAGEEVVLLLGSAVFDTYLSVYGPSGTLINFSDDLPNTSDSGLDLFLPESGRYLVVVSSYFGGDTGPYSITRYSPDQAPLDVFEDQFVDFGGGPLYDDLPMAQVVSVPTTLSGELSVTMVPIDIDGWSHYVQTYSFELSAEARVGIDLRSDAFDAYLYLFDEFGEQIAANDDDPNDPTFSTNSRITMTLGPGLYTVVATSFFELETGPYELTIEPF